jgi:murein DD-endopeptidase MepM/ murein hydrolase activator NlpD
MGARHRRTRTAAATLLTTLMAATLLVSPSANAQPSLADEIAAADAELKAAQAKLASTFAKFTAAEDRHKKATAAAKAASDKAAQAASAATAAEKEERDLRQKFDTFAAANYRQGTVFNSMSAYVDAKGASDLLDRASLLSALSGEYGEVLDATQEAVDRKSATASAAEATRDKAVRDRDAAAKAKTDAEAAYRTAVSVQDKAKAETARLAARRAALAGQSGGSDDAVAQVTGGVARPAVGTLTSTYGARWGTIHYGIDIANSIGTPILSAMAGEVIDSGPASGFGLWVRVGHDNGLITVYGHINESLVSVGQRVAAGEQIATMGNRGQSTGPHLHFEVHENGNKIDPLPWLRAHGVAI